MKMDIMDSMKVIDLFDIMQDNACKMDLDENHSV